MKYTPRQGGGTVTYDSADWRAGLMPQGLFSSTQNLKYTGINGFSTITAIDPFTVYGILSPGTAPSAHATNSGQLSGVVTAVEVTDNSTALAVDAGGRVQQMTISGSAVSITSAGIYPHTIAYAAGSTYVGQDGILYRHNSGGTTAADSKVSFFYSAYNSNNWDVGALVNLATFDDDFMSSVPASPLDISSGDGDDPTQRTAQHPLEIGADGILYIGSGRYVHGYDGNTGANGTFYSKVLTLPQGTEIIAMLKFKDIFLIACNYYSNGAATSSGRSGTGKALLYTWDYTSLDIIDVVDLEDFTVSALFAWKGTPTVITNGPSSSNGGNKVKVITGNTVTEVSSFDGTAPINRGIVVSSGIIYINSGGKIISVGDKFNKSNPSVVNNLALLGTTGLSGVLFYNEIITKINLTGSSSSGGSNHVINNINNGKGTASCKLPLFSPNFPAGKIGRLKFVEIEYYQPLSENVTNGSFTLTIDTDSGTTNNPIITNISTVSFPLIRRYTRNIYNETLPRFSMFEVNMSWVTSGGGNSPTIVKVTVDFDDELEITN